MIAVCELYHRAEAHAPFNAGLIDVIRLAFPDDPVCFLGEASHVSEVQKQVGSSISSSLCWKTIARSRRQKSFFFRLASEFKTIQGLVRSFEQTSTSRLVFTSISSSTLLAIKLLKRFKFKNIPIQVISHGEIKSGVIGRRHRHPLRRLEEMRTALTLFQGSAIQYLVLEDNIRELIVQSLPSLAPNIEVLEHPLPPNESTKERRKIASPVHFGFLGLANESKGFSTFVDLAVEIARTHPGQAEFHAVGRLAPGAKVTRGMEILATKPGPERLSRREYVARLNRLHFIVMPYHADYYDTAPSGTLLDAIAWEIPIIATKLPIFERAFKKYGAIGYLFNDKNELNRITANILAGAETCNYTRQIDNLHDARLLRSPNNLAAVYREICDRGARLGLTSNGNASSSLH